MSPALQGEQLGSHETCLLTVRIRQELKQIRQKKIDHFFLFGSIFKCLKMCNTHKGQKINDRIHQDY